MKVLVGMTITLGLLASACSSITAPDPQPSTAGPQPSNSTRIIRLGGNLTFGNVSLRDTSVKQAEMTVSNDGNDTLQVTSITGPCAGTYLTVPGATSFAVAAGATVPVAFRFAPLIRIDCSGTVTVVGNETSGTNTIPVIARGVQPGCEAIPPQDPLPPFC